MWLETREHGVALVSAPGQLRQLPLQIIEVNIALLGVLAVAAGGAPVLRKLVAVSAVTDPAPPEAPGLGVPSSSSTAGSRSRVRLISHSHSATTIGRPGHEFGWCGSVAGWCDGGVGRGKAQGGGGGEGGGVGGDLGIGMK